MRNKISLGICKCVLPILILISFFVSPVFAKNRDEIIDQELNCINKALQNNPAVTWGDVCYTAAVDPSQRRNAEINDALEAASNKNSNKTVVKKSSSNSHKKLALTKNQDLADDNSGSMMEDVEFESDDADTTEFYSIRHNDQRKKFEFGTEIYEYTYTEVIGVKDSATFYGLFANYTFHDKPTHTMFRLDGRVATGSVTYEGTGTQDGIRDTVAEARALGGYDIPLRKTTLLTPYVGFGYRYLFDDFSSLPPQVINGQSFYSGYDRESNYLYVPVGIEVNNKFSRGWNLQGTVEYDYFIKGWQKSHFENMRTIDDQDPGIDELVNDQSDGVGFRTSIRLTKETPKLDVFVEPFFRYWHIEDSDVDFQTSGGQLICAGNLCSAGREPDNTTKELGVKLGIRY